MPIMVKVAFFALPVLGGFIIINTIVRFTELLSRSRHYSKEWQQMLATTFNHHVIVCGLGHVGTRIVEHLVAAGTDCVAIEQEDSPALRRIEALGVPVLIGDVRDADMLDKAQVKRADTLIAATDVDMANITAALIAREVNPAIKLVLRLFDQTLAKRIEKSLGINAAFSTSALAAPLFAAAATSRNVRGSVEIEGKVLHTVELEVRPDARLAGRMLDSLRAQLEVTFLMLHRGGTTDWNPSPSTVLTSGDRVLVVTTLESLSALEALNR
jgi:Trk K+ transport system NAD-binding subunit